MRLRKHCWLLSTRLLSLALIAPLLVTACGGGDGVAAETNSSPRASSSPSGTNPVPSIDSTYGLSPSCVPQGEASLGPGNGHKLLVNGQNFRAGSVVRWNGSDRPTTFNGSDQIIAEISPQDIAAVGTATVTVINPAPGGGLSNSSTFTITAGGVSPQSITLDSTGKFAYVANEGCLWGQVSMYTIDTTTGLLASMGPPVFAYDEGGNSVVLDPSGKFVYVASWGEGDYAGAISAYTIDTGTGVLTHIQTLRQGVLAPWSVVVDPSGRFAYVANEGGYAPTVVTEYTIDTTTGKLAPIGSTVSGGRAVAVTVDPSGRFAYVANRSEPPGGGGAVSMYTIDHSTGVLVPQGLVATGKDPASVTVDPTSKFAYVTNSGSNDVSVYAITPSTGALIAGGTIATGSGPSAIAVHPSGKFAYVTNSGSNDISIYTINAGTGALIASGTIATGSGPSAMAIHPSGEFAYVTNSGSNDVWIYGINAATGALTLIATTTS